MDMVDEALKWATYYNIVPLHSTEGEVCQCKDPQCSHQGKHPIFRGWMKEATKDKSQIRKWWGEYPNANIGIVLGKESGLVALDIDGPDGEESLEQFPEHILNTLQVKSGRMEGGRHLIFKTLPGEVLKKLGKKTHTNPKGFANGIDFLAEGCLIVAPPSIHKSGKRYSVINDVEPIPLPKEIRKVLKDRQNQEYRVEKSYQENGNGSLLTQEVYEGEGRNDHVTKVFGTFLATSKGDKKLAIGLTMDINEKYCKPPLDDVELSTIFNSIIRTDSNKKQKSSAEVTERKQNDKREIPFWYTDEFLEIHAVEEDLWAIEDWFLKDTICLQVALPGVGKTVFNTALSLSFATGIPFLGMYPIHPKYTGRVLHMQLEDAPYSTAKKIISSMSHGDIEYDDETEDFVFPQYDRTRDILIPKERDFRFDRPDMMIKLENTIKNHDIKLVIVDPLYFTIPIKEFMIDATDYLQPIKTLRDKYGVSFLLSHHSSPGKGGSGLRKRDKAWGGVFVNAFQETGWQLEQTEESLNNRDILEVVISRNFKDEHKPEDIFRFDFKNGVFNVEKILPINDDPRVHKGAELTNSILGEKEFKPPVGKAAAAIERVRKPPAPRIDSETLKVQTEAVKQVLLQTPEAGFTYFKKHVAPDDETFSKARLSTIIRGLGYRYLNGKYTRERENA